MDEANKIIQARLRKSIMTRTKAGQLASRLDQALYNSYDIKSGESHHSGGKLFISRKEDVEEVLRNVRDFLEQCAYEECVKILDGKFD